MIDSALNVALHLGVIRTGLSEEMKDFSILGFPSIYSAQMTESFNLSVQHFSSEVMCESNVLTATQTAQCLRSTLSDSDLKLSDMNKR